MSDTQRDADDEDEAEKDGEPEGGDRKSDKRKSDKRKSGVPESDDRDGDDRDSDDRKSDAPESDEPDEEDDDEPLLPEGNPLRYVRGTIAILAGAFVAFCLMAVKEQYRYGVPIASLAILVATFGVLDFLGTFDDPDDRVAGRAALRDLARPAGLALGGSASLWGLVCLAVDGRLSASHPVLAAGVLVPASFLTIVVGVYQIGERLGAWGPDADGTPRPLLRRHGFWVVLATTLLYLPTLGSHSLSDSWETHYGEVAREILSRNDWISTWWAQDGWFWSKPVLDFWIQALAMATFGVRYGSDQMLSAVREGRIPWPEWAVRLPIFLLTLIAVYLLYKAVARAFGRRAGLLGAIVLLTMPQWFLLSHQTMTDMPFVAPMASAMALFLMGMQEDKDEEIRVYEIDLGVAKLRVSAFHLVFGAVIACALPQVLYLASRNLSLDIRGFHAHLDAFSSGSPGNCGTPGNVPCHAGTPVLRGLHPALQALIWAQALALALYMSWGERRRQRLYFLAAWFFGAIATMGKGPAGVGLPILCAAAYVVVARRRRDPRDGTLTPFAWWLRAFSRMEIAAGILIVLAVAIPWFVAMYARHGQPFTDRLLFHDMFKRAFTHVHDTNEGDDVSFRFYVWQLGYAMFPWTGLVPAGLVWWLRRDARPDDTDEADPKSDASAFLATWFIFAFALFSLMLTKFHHYILPAVPPAAMLTGVVLDALIDRSLPSPENDPRSERDAVRGALLYGLGLAVGVAILVWGTARAFTRGGLTTGAAGVVIGLGVLAAAVKLAGHGAPRSSLRSSSDATDDDAFRDRFERTMLGAATVAGAALVLAVGRDLSLPQEGMPNQIRLVHLITYNYRRPWPPSLDFTPTLGAFTAVFAALLFLLAIARIRRHVLAALVALGLTFGAWGIGVYLMKISPHWGQRETMLAYYEAARGAPGQLVAYQMNWKGENFYSGNHVPAFVSSGKKFQDYIVGQKKKRERTFYFVTEHGRTGTLSNELGHTKSFEKLTTPELDNKFVLVRATFE